MARGMGIGGFSRLKISKLSCHSLAENDPAGVSSHGDTRCVGGRAVALIDRRPVGRRHVGRVVDVFNSNRNASEGLVQSGCIATTSRLHCHVGRQKLPGADGVFALRDTLQTGGNKGFRSQLSGFYFLNGLSGGEFIRGR